MASRYPHGHAYDLFVSYSTTNLEWVRAFHDDLINDVNQLADFDIYPFLDKDRVQPGYVWNEELLATARDSALFVPILSPRFFLSDYCQKEVNAFIEANKLSSGLAHRSRILPVELLSSAPADHVPAQLQATSFYSEGSDGIPHELRRNTQEYTDALRKLSYAIAQLLKAVPPKEQQRPAVYLAPDFSAASDKLRASLEHHFDVLPEDPKTLLGLSPEAFQQSLEHDFERCFVSVHPLTETPFAKPLVEAHLEFARTQTKPRLLWTPNRRDDLTNAGFEWFTSQAEIEDRIRRIYEKPSETKSSTAEPLIYFLCPDRANKAQAKPLLEALEKRGVHVYPSPLEGAADQAMQTHVSALDELDGCLIYYGNVDRDWFDAVFLRVQKKIRQRGLLSAIFLAPPETPHKSEDLLTVGVPLVKAPEAAVNLFLGAASGATA